MKTKDFFNCLVYSNLKRCYLSHSLKAASSFTNTELKSEEKVDLPVSWSATPEIFWFQAFQMRGVAIF